MRAVADAWVGGGGIVASRRASLGVAKATHGVLGCVRGHSDEPGKHANLLFEPSHDAPQDCDRPCHADCIGGPDVRQLVASACALDRAAA